MSHNHAQLISEFAKLESLPIVTTYDVLLAYCEATNTEPIDLLGVLTRFNSKELKNESMTSQLRYLQAQNEDLLTRMEKIATLPDEIKNGIAQRKGKGKGKGKGKAESTVSDSDMLANLKRDYLSGRITAVEFATTLKTLGLSDTNESKTDEKTHETSRGKIREFDAASPVRKSSAVTVYARKVKANVYTVNSGDSAFVHALTIGEKFNADIYSANEKNKRLFNVAQRCVVTAVRANGGFSFKIV